MPQGSSTNTNTAPKRTNNKGKTGGKGPKKPKTEYVDPLKVNTFKDPFKTEVKPYEGNFTIPEYKESTLEDIDPFPESNYKRPKVDKLEDTPKLPVKMNPRMFGNSIGSVKRSIDIATNLDF